MGGPKTCANSIRSQIEAKLRLRSISSGLSSTLKIVKVQRWSVRVKIFESGNQLEHVWEGLKRAKFNQKSDPSQTLPFGAFLPDSRIQKLV